MAELGPKCVLQYRISLALDAFRLSESCLFRFRAEGFGYELPSSPPPLARHHPRHLECLTEPSLDEAPADETGGEVVEGGEDVGPPLVADGDATEAGEPGERALDHPSVPAQTLAAFDTAPGDAWNDRPPAQRASAVGEVIALVGVQFGGSAPWPASTLADGRYGIDECLQQLAVVAVGWRDPQGERDAVGVHEDVALGARLAAIRRARAGLLAPLFAGTLALSTAARSQLMALA